MEFVGFSTWQEVLDYVRSGAPVYYKAPLNYQPSYVGTSVRGNGRKVRVVPANRNSPEGADPFWADEGHLDRFRKPLVCADCGVDLIEGRRCAPCAIKHEKSRKTYRVAFHFSGVVSVLVTGNPEDDSWEDAIAHAWADVKPEDVSQAANLDEAVNDGEEEV